MAELVDVGGYRLAISVSGADSPPVVCVSGLTGDAGEWSGVRAALRSQAMFIAYGRPALGGSDPLPATLAAVPRPASWAAEQLHVLLARAGVPAPRVLVGHSIGGLIVEAHLARRPGDVAGVVLNDPTDPRANFEIGKPVPICADANDGGIRFCFGSCRDERDEYPTPPTMPAVVVSAAVDSWQRTADAAVIAPCTLAEADELWQGYQRDWTARPRALHVSADHAGHCVHEDAPTLVAFVIGGVVRAVREGRMFGSTSRPWNRLAAALRRPGEGRPRRSARPTGAPIGKLPRFAITGRTPVTAAVDCRTD
ncbi:alpha/beta fold hydrolase [Parafrankia sp. FMc2]|uniref:alpha/beta fold hydrolase n=1 Tax=Parafrankia sp. FMc2 TaxID=3233196 RepID=UPI0034D68F5C